MSNFLLSVKPNIDRTNLQNLVVKVGLTLTLDVNITGEPPPEVTWLFEGKVSFTIVTENRESLFFFFFILGGCILLRV
jgi:hypothetical protein